MANYAWIGYRFIYRNMHRLCRSKLITGKPFFIRKNLPAFQPDFFSRFHFANINVKVKKRRRKNSVNVDVKIANK